MRFMMIMWGLANDEHAKAMGKYNEALREAGVLLAVDGLRSPATGARVSFKSGKPAVLDGPLSESKEVVGGYWMIQVRSRDEAIEWAKRCPGLPDETIEVRPVWEAAANAKGA